MAPLFYQLAILLSSLNEAFDSNLVRHAGSVVAQRGMLVCYYKGRKCLTRINMLSLPQLSPA
jgi:hypothetical protein